MIFIPVAFRGKVCDLFLNLHEVYEEVPGNVSEPLHYKMYLRFCAWFSTVSKIFHDWRDASSRM